MYETLRQKLLHLSSSEKETLVEEDEEAVSEGAVIDQLMDLIIRLEVESRDIILGSMEKGVPRTLLLADRNGK